MARTALIVIDMLNPYEHEDAERLADSGMRGYEVSVPSDAVAHIGPDWARAALEMMAENMHADLTSVADGVLTD